MKNIFLEIKRFFFLVYGKCYVILNSEIKVEFGDHFKNES